METFRNLLFIFLGCTVLFLLIPKPDQDYFVTPSDARLCSMNPDCLREIADDYDTMVLRKASGELAIKRAQELRAEADRLELLGYGAKG